VNVVAEMKKQGCIIGGEGNGGVILPSLHYGRDALIGTALFLSHLANKGVSASCLRDSFPFYYMSKNRVELTDGFRFEDTVEKISKAYSYAQISTVDGLRIDFDDQKKWVCLRKSNTEPIMRVYAEAPDKTAAEALSAEIITML